jgi:hypothetical protein
MLRSQKLARTVFLHPLFNTRKKNSFHIRATITALNAVFIHLPPLMRKIPHRNDAHIFFDVLVSDFSTHRANPELV